MLLKFADAFDQHALLIAARFISFEEDVEELLTKFHLEGSY